MEKKLVSTYQALNGQNFKTAATGRIFGDFFYLDPESTQKLRETEKPLCRGGVQIPLPLLPYYEGKFSSICRETNCENVNSITQNIYEKVVIICFNVTITLNIDEKQGNRDMPQIHVTRHFSRLVAPTVTFSKQQKTRFLICECVHQISGLYSFSFGQEA